MTITTDLLDTAASSARRRLATTLRDKVAGEDGESRAREIWQTVGERPFGETDPVWIVHADASMFVGGIRALLLQTLHPLAMAG
ncbi:MAG: oxygenase MpaB family protein, partial [Lapillicoccus sp.]